MVSEVEERWFYEARNGKALRILPGCHMRNVLLPPDVVVFTLSWLWLSTLAQYNGR